MSFDLAIVGGTVVSPTGCRRLNVFTRAGKIARISAGDHEAHTRVDAAGLLVFPGMIDTHVHFMDPGDATREDFLTGSAAAACAGVTTVIEHTHGHPVRSGEELGDKLVYLKRRSVVDYGLAAHAWPDRLDEIEPLWRGGISYFKVFTCETHGVPGFDAAMMSEVFRRTASIGARCLVHCEDESITSYWERGLRAAGRVDPGLICEWRNRQAEATATVVTAFLARWNRAHVVIAHASNPEILRLVEREVAWGGDVLIESCPQYLELREDELHEFGPLRKFTPPARAQSTAELEQMWSALSCGRIHHLSSDHAPSTIAQKNAGTIWDVHFGLPGIDTTLPVLLDAASRGLISYERVSEVYSAAPARAYGFATRKGAIAEGLDADIVLVDPSHRWLVANEDMRSRAGWSPFAGRTLTGKAVATFLRGQLIATRRGPQLPPGTGEFIPGSGFGQPVPTSRGGVSEVCATN